MNKVYLTKLLIGFAISFCIISFISCGKKTSEEDREDYKPVAGVPGTCLEAANVSDPQTVISLCLQEAYLGNLLAEVALGEVYSQIKDWEHAGEWYKLAAMKGDLYSQYQLAKLYLDRKGPNKDIRTALYWLLESGKAGYAPSQLQLAKLYQKGDRIEKNEYLAFQWFKACADVEPDAAFEVGLAYLRGGLGQDKNIDLGARYLSFAAKYDNPRAKAILMNITEESKKDAIEDVNVLNNMSQLTEEAKTGSPEEQLQLAKDLMKHAIPQYDKAALHWVTQAAAKGHEEAKYWLGVCYLDGIGTEVDYIKSFAIFSELALLGYPMAQFQLGKMYYEGKGIEQDNELGKKWIRQAAEQGVEEASSMLASLSNEELSEQDDEHTDENL